VCEHNWRSTEKEPLPHPWFSGILLLLNLNDFQENVSAEQSYNPAQETLKCYMSQEIMGVMQFDYVSLSHVTSVISGPNYF